MNKIHFFLKRLKEKDPDAIATAAFFGGIWINLVMLIGCSLFIIILLKNL